MTTDINKFSLSQATSNSDGKTSGSGSAGLYLVFVGGLIGLISTIATLFRIPDISNIYIFAGTCITFGAGLLGYRKSVEKTEIENRSKE